MDLIIVVLFALVICSYIGIAVRWNKIQEKFEKEKKNLQEKLTDQALEFENKILDQSTEHHLAAAEWSEKFKTLNDQLTKATEIVEKQIMQGSTDRATISEQERTIQELRKTLDSFKTHQELTAANTELEALVGRQANLLTFKEQHIQAVSFELQVLEKALIAIMNKSTCEVKIKNTEQGKIVGCDVHLQSKSAPDAPVCLPCIAREAMEHFMFTPNRTVTLQP